MAQLVSHHSSQLIIRVRSIADQVKQPCVDHYFPPWHTEGIDLLALHYIELPAQRREHLFIAILLEVGIGSSS